MLSTHVVTLPDAPISWGPVIFPEPALPSRRERRPMDLAFYGDEQTALFIRLHNFITADSQAIVEIDVDFDNGSSTEAWQVTGTSRKDPADKPDEDVGFLLATSRALAAIARTFERQAEGKIKHAEDMRAANKRRKQKP